MRNRIGYGAALGVLLVLVGGRADGYQLSDDEVHIPPDYYTLQPPRVGETMVDPVFGTVIKRLTDAGKMSYERMTPEYTQSTPFSLENKWLLLRSSGGWWHLLDSEGAHERRISGRVGEPRWSRTDPDVFYYWEGKSVRAYNAASGSSSTLRKFSQFSRIEFGGGQSDVSDNNRTTVIGDGRYVLLYDLATDTEYPALDAGEHKFDFTCPTPDGDGFIVSWLQRGTGRWMGAELFDNNGEFQRQLLNAGGHGDVGRDVDGAQVYFQSNAPTSPLQPPDSGLAVVKVDLSDGDMAVVFSLHPRLSMHMSARAGDGWVYVTTYDWSNPDPSAQWFPYSNEIVRVRADGSVAERLVHHRSRGNSYWRTPRAVVSMEGDKLVYASDFQLEARPGEYVDTYILDLDAQAADAPPQTVSRSQEIGGAR